MKTPCWAFPTRSQLFSTVGLEPSVNNNQTTEERLERRKSTKRVHSDPQAWSNVQRFAGSGSSSEALAMFFSGGRDVWPDACSVSPEIRLLGRGRAFQLQQKRCGLCSFSAYHLKLLRTAKIVVLLDCWSVNLSRELKEFMRSIQMCFESGPPKLWLRRRQRARQRKGVCPSRRASQRLHQAL